MTHVVLALVSILVEAADMDVGVQVKKDVVSRHGLARGRIV